VSEAPSRACCATASMVRSVRASRAVGFAPRVREIMMRAAARRLRAGDLRRRVAMGIGARLSVLLRG